MKKIIVTIVVIMFLVMGCTDPSMQIVEMPNSFTEMDFNSYPGKVSVSTLSDFTGTAITEAQMSELTSAPAEAMSVIPKMAAMVEDQIAESRVMGVYAVMGLYLMDETANFEWGSVTVNELSAMMSQASEIDSIGDEIAEYLSDFAISSVDTIAAESVIQLKADVELDVTNLTSSELGPIKSGVWHHLSNLSIDATEVDFTNNDATGNVTINAKFNSSVGFTISGLAEANGKFVISVDMIPIEVTISITEIVDMSEAAADENSFYIDLVQLLTEDSSATDLFTISFEAYDNTDTLISSRELPLLDAFEVLYY